MYAQRKGQRAWVSVTVALFVAITPSFSYMLPWRIDAIAHTRLGDDDLGRRGIQLDLPPEVRNVYPQILLRAAKFAPPHGIEDLLVRQSAAR